jgi:putative membrane protein
VPISNFLGWSFTVWIFFQLFALYQRRRGSEDLGRALPTTHYLQSIIVYFWTGFGFVLGYLLRPANTAISDAVGHVWQTGDIYETMAIVSIYTMIFVSILALVILYRDQVTQRKVQP